MIHLNMFNPEKSAQSPREHYQRMLAMAEAKLASLKDNPFWNDEKIAAAWKKESDNSLVRAAGFILQHVGKTDTQLLRDAVAPENLRDVLLRGGATGKQLMMIGEGHEVLGILVRQREREMARMSERVKTFSDPNVQSIIGRMWKKTQDAEAKLVEYEKKPVWSKMDVGYYESLEIAFLEALSSVTDACVNYEKMAKRKE